MLAPDELRRAARFRFRTHGIRFAAGRAALRRILSQYLDRTPAALRFGAAPGGKPHLAGPTEASPLRFNLAHTAALALIAVTRHREVGVDVERLRRDVQYDALAARYFAADEIAGLRALDPPDRPAAFFGCWTRKEAFLKARGDGLRVPLARFAVAITPGPGPVALSIADDPAEAARWSVVSVDAGPGYAAAVAAAAGPVRLHCWDDRDGTPRD